MKIRNKKLEIFTNQHYEGFVGSQTITGKNFSVGNTELKCAIGPIEKMTETFNDTCSETMSSPKSDNKRKNLNQEVKDIINLIEDEKNRNSRRSRKNSLNYDEVAPS